MLNKNKTITFFVNGNNTIGFGHVSRCLILAKEFKLSGYNILFVIPKECSLVDKIELEYKIYPVKDFKNSNLENLPENFKEIAFIDVIESDFLILKTLKTNKIFNKIISITLFDFEQEKRYEDITFFPSFESLKEKTIQNINGVTKQFIGKEYLTFGNTKSKKNTLYKNSKNKLLITMGGADPENLTLKVLNSLKEENINIKVILNKKAKSYEKVNLFCSSMKNIELVEFVPNISSTFNQYKLIVINGGLTRYEAILERVPFIAISIDEKQYNISDKVCKLGVGMNLGVGSLLKNEKINSEIMNLFKNEKQLEKMHHLSEGIIDSNGSRRIVDKVNHIIYNEKNNIV